MDGVIAMFVLGGICLLPGGYALHHIIRAFRAKTVDERDRALEDVPEWSIINLICLYYLS